MSLGNGWQGQSGVHRMVIGKMLGGSQSHNAFKYNRGSQHDYNNFARVTNVRDCFETFIYQKSLTIYKTAKLKTDKCYIKH